jgi:hypothetical protein
MSEDQDRVVDQARILRKGLCQALAASFHKALKHDDCGVRIGRIAEKMADGLSYVGTQSLANPRQVALACVAITELNVVRRSK